MQLARFADHDSGVRRAEARALAGTVDQPAVRDALLARLAEDDWDVQAAAAEALRQGIIAEKFGAGA